MKRILPHRRGAGELPFEVLFKKFKSILERNNRILELMADMGDKLGGEYVFDRQYLLSASQSLSDLVFKMISDLSVLSERKNRELFLAFGRIQHQIQEELAGRHSFPGGGLVLPLFEAGGQTGDLDGGKMSALAELHGGLHLDVPDGFVITTRAYFEFMEQDGLRQAIREGLDAWDGRDQQALRALSERVQAMILQAEVPRPLAAAIESGLDALRKRRKGEAAPLLALRSSAWGENGDASFAGQYLSVLGVPRREVLGAWRRVVAGTYGYEAWRYRLERDFREHEIAMAVGCQEMAGGAVSGVLHTWAEDRGQPAMLISATWGLGAGLVGGEVGGDSFVLGRTAPYPVWAMNVVDKPRRLVLEPGGGTAWRDVQPELTRAPCLTPDQLQRLAETAMTVERWYKRPQEVEWSLDDGGRLWILQSRPLRLRPARGPRLPVDDATRRAEVVFCGKGMTAQRGVAVGRVVLVRDDADLDDFPHGAILVSRYTSPRFSRVMCRAGGIITDVGSPAGHMATIAREYRVPTIVGAEVATRLLGTGDEITLDATSATVYRGRVSELDHFELTEELVFEESYEYRLLKRLLARIAPLNLVDPHAADFTPQACRTFHDITRYIHEKAVDVLIGLSERHGARNGSAPRRLVSDLPLGLTILDAGGGLSCPPDAASVTPGQILSRPLRELLAGIRDADMWCTDPVSVDMGSFMSSVTRTFCANLAGPREVGRNLAVVLPQYMNLHLRLGYHYTIVDAYLSETVNDNMLYFRFMGGVTDFTRRSRRARFIAEVLARFDFRVEVHGDLVVGRLKKLSLPRMVRRVRMLGGLIGYTRQLDALMHDDAQISHHVETFTQAIHAVLGGQGER